MGLVCVRGVLSTIMAMSLILSTCVFDICLSGVDPQFTFSPSERPVLGNTLTITCSATGEFWAIFLKEKKGEIKRDIAEQSAKSDCRAATNLRPGAYVPPCQNEWKLSVVMPNVTPDDSAEYICDITMLDNSPNAIASKTVTVIVPPSAPRITGNVTVIEGHRLALSCDGATSPGPQAYQVTTPVKYRWQKNSLFIQEGSTEISSYYVERAGPQDGGLYRCIATNEADRNYSQETKVEIYYLPREVKIQTKKTSRLAGEVEEFRCTASDANPIPTLRLMRVNGPSTFEVDSQITVSLTKNLKLKPSDNGAEFYCEATSGAKIPNQKKTSRKQRYEVTFAPFVTVNMTKGTVRENESTEVICNATGGNPSKIDSYQWEFRRPDSDVYTKLGDRFRELALPHVQYDQAGYYRCTATNAAGSQSHEERLYVKFSPRLDEAFKLQPQVAGEVGKSASFSLHLNSNPQPSSVEWYWSQGKISPSNPDFLMNEKTPYQISLRIPSVRVEHYGQFNCTVGNGIGEKTYSFKLMEAGPPLMPSSLAAADVTARSITLQWTSEFTGGSPQTFSIMYKKADDMWPNRDQITDIADPGYKQQVRHRITGLESDSWYTFRVRSTNTHPGNNQSPYAPLGAARTLELPKTEDLQAYRDGNEIEVSWRQPTGTYDGAKIQYCVEGTTTCRNHTVLDISRHTSTLTVEDGKTFIYKLHLLAKDDVLFTSPAFLAKLAPIRTSNIGFIAGGAGLFVLIIAIIIIFICCNRRKQHKKKKRETELHNLPPRNVHRRLNTCLDETYDVSRALMQGAENPALNNTLTRSFNDLGGMTQHLDVANLRKQDLDCLYENTKVTKPNQNGGQANMPGPDVVPNSDQPENEYANAMMAGIPVGQVEPMQRLPDKEYENLMVAARNKHPHIPDQPIQTVSPEGIVYTKVFYTMPNNNSRPMPQNNAGDHYAKIDVNRTASQPRTQEPPPYHSRTQSPRPQSPEDQVDRSRPQSPPRSPLHLDESEHYLEDVV